MILPALYVLALFLPLSETVAADSLFASPLFGDPLGGDPFDDGTTAVIPQVVRLRSIRICHGDAIDGIQLIYTLPKNNVFIGPSHGKTSKAECPENSKIRNIVFKENEVLVHIEGLVQKRWEYISQLKLFTSIDGGPPTLRGGPFGRGNYSTDLPFSLTGEVRGFFGRNGDVFDALGFYIDTNLPLNSYKKTDRFGEVGLTSLYFDDFEILSSRNAGKPLKITNMVISYASYIVGIQVTFLTSNGTSITLAHGYITREYWIDDSTALAKIDFDADEWITEVDISYLSYIISLRIETTNSKGVVRSYGPFGNVNEGNTTTIQGVVYGFYGTACGPNDAIPSLGFYV